MNIKDAKVIKIFKIISLDTEETITSLNSDISSLTFDIVATITTELSVFINLASVNQTVYQPML